jgi:hypothetical protein
MNANGLQIGAGRASRTNLALSAELRIYKFLSPESRTTACAYLLLVAANYSFCFTNSSAVKTGILACLKSFKFRVTRILIPCSIAQ